MLGISLPTMDSKIRQGMPYVQKGARGKPFVFDSVAVIHWEVEQAAAKSIGRTSNATLDELKRRKLEADVTVVEIDAARRLGQVAEIETIERQWSEICSEFRRRMMKVGSRAAPSIIGEDDENVIKSIINDEVMQGLTALGINED